ncbi:MAG: CvpA family protein [Eubacteriaceae bacterium]|jgi:uncharacterized membrane protein required for colicin V production|nr:CvpA family protein [Eubacteriaceae bacterium]
MNVIDIAILVVVLLFGLMGFRHGLVKSILSFAGAIIAFIVAKIFYVSFALTLTTKTNWDTKISAWVYERLLNTFPSGNVTLSETSSSFQWFFSKLFNESASHSTIQTLSNSVSHFVMNVLAFVIIFLAMLLIIALLGFVLDHVMKLPGLSFLNKLGGFGIGLAKGVLICAVFISLITFFSLFSKNAAFSEMFANSVFAKYLYIGRWLM